MRLREKVLGFVCREPSFPELMTFFIFSRFAYFALFFSVLFGVDAAVARGKLPDPSDEYIIVVGGPALVRWEQYRVKNQRHDQWWGNFVRASRIRIDQLQRYYKGPVNITWMVYRPGYISRATEDGQPLISFIESVRDKYKIRLIWFDSGDDVIRYVNSGQNRSRLKVGGFEYFGHSNKYCFVFDYSNEVLGASKSFLHQDMLTGINRKVFAKRTFAKSWGCHSGESFSVAFKKSTGVKMVGAIGKTDYSEVYKQVLPFLSSSYGKWTR